MVVYDADGNLIDYDPEIEKKGGFLYRKILPLGDMNVWVAVFPDDIQVKPVLPKERDEYIHSCSDLRIMRQRYAVWKLLDEAVTTQYGTIIGNWPVQRNENGKWHCSDLPFHFSLSHCDNIVAVTLGTALVGVDVARVDRFAGSNMDALASRVLCEAEWHRYLKTENKQKPQVLANYWTRKEAIFKMANKPEFVPSSIRCNKYTSFAHQVTIDREYMIACAHW